MSGGFVENYEKDWEDIRQKGVLPNVTTLEEYARRYEENLLRLHDALADRRGIVTKPDELKELHSLLFHNITPWAGQLAERQMAVYSIYPRQAKRVVLFKAVRPDLAESEFKLLDLQIGKLEKQIESNSQTELVRLAAFYHARFERIHAFADGNGRLGRILLEHAMWLITKQAPRIQIHRAEYDRCLRHTQSTQNIAPLSEMLHRSYGLEKTDAIGFLPSMYQMDPQTTELPTKEALRLSQRERLKLIGATSPPLSRRWFSEADLVPMLKLPHHFQATENFLTAQQYLLDLQKERQPVGKAIMALRKIQVLKPYSLRDESEVESGERYVEFARKLFFPAISVMTPESREKLIDAWKDLFVRGLRLGAIDFNRLYLEAKYVIPELPRHVSQPSIDTFRRQSPSQTGPEEKKERGHHPGQ
jgi:fido (protein-threonine AMPylation protein)